MQASDEWDLEQEIVDTSANNGRSDFDKTLEVLFARARTAYPEIELAPEVFGARIELVVLKNPDSQLSWAAAARFAGELHFGDLYLSTACAQKDDFAWQRLRATYFKLLCDIFCYVTSSKDNAPDLADGLLNDLFLPDRSGRSRIASYDGRSSLATWLRVIVEHRQINDRQKRRHEFCVLEAIPEPRDLTALIRLESILRDGHRETAAINAFVQACASLLKEERQLLIWRYGRNLQLGRIAETVGVHQSTITRQIERICRKVRAEAILILATRHKLSNEAIEDCIGMLTDGHERSEFVWDALNQAEEGAAPEAELLSRAARAS
jgi:RNA polymerase sigma-70 factor